MNPSRAALWAAAFTGVQAGAAIVATRVVVGDLGPATLAAVRYAIAVAALLPFVLHSGVRVRLQRRDALPVLLLGAAQFGLLIALLNHGLRTVPAAPAALLFACFPLLTLLVAAAAGHERLTRRKLTAVLVTLAGVALALGAAVFDGGSAAGALAILAAALTGAVCSVGYRPYLQRYPALHLGVWAMAASMVVLVPASIVEHALPRLAALSATAWQIVVFIGLSSAIGFVAWLWALRRADASRATLFLALTPLAAMVFGALALDEPVPWRLWLALAFVSAGLAIARPPTRPASAIG